MEDHDLMNCPRQGQDVLGQRKSPYGRLNTINDGLGTHERTITSLREKNSRKLFKILLKGGSLKENDLVHI